MALILDHRRTVYLSSYGSHVSIDHDAFQIRRPDHPMVRVPVQSVESIVCFGDAEFTTAAMDRCAQGGIDLAWLSRSGRFRFGVRSPTHGNVFLRMEQYRAASDADRTLDIAKAFVGAKLLNSRVVLLDAAKDRAVQTRLLRSVADDLVKLVEQAKCAGDIDVLRGLEGAGAKRYFAGWASLLAGSPFKFERRDRRPPTDPVNAMLSFGYSLLTARANGGAEHVGLDPQVGFLHPPRPGRPSLALDLMEELRAPLVDRLVLTLLNRRQVGPKSFTAEPTGAVRMSDEARSLFLAAFDTHLTTEVPHRVLEQPIERRKIPHLQAQLLARHLRGDVAHYLPFRTTGR